MFRTVRVRIQLLDFSSTLAIAFILAFDWSLEISNSKAGVWWTILPSLLQGLCQKSVRIYM